MENVEIIHKTKYYYLMAKIEKRFPHPVGFERRKFANGFCFDSVASPMIALWTTITIRIIWNAIA